MDLQDYQEITEGFDFCVQELPDCGKGAIAKKSLPAHEEILQEAPLVCWPLKPSSSSSSSAADPTSGEGASQTAAAAAAVSNDPETSPIVFCEQCLRITSCPDNQLAGPERQDSAVERPNARWCSDECEGRAAGWWALLGGVEGVESLRKNWTQETGVTVEAVARAVAKIANTAGLYALQLAPEQAEHAALAALRPFQRLVGPPEDRFEGGQAAFLPRA
mmetsp:Transcript_14000/g.28005  ORF Transcript_14000/g.28005 Transcript_14000/m.28005 type:complete len:219 (+) Transcript_14000:250-906(+)